MIKESFIALIEEKGYENITITDIADQALINRKTFYAHYESKAMLFDEVIQEVVLWISAGTKFETAGVNAYTGREELRGDLETILANIHKNRQVILVLFEDISSYELKIQLTNLLENVFMQKVMAYGTPDPQLPSALLAECFVASLLKLFQWWLHQYDVDKSEGAAIFFRLFDTGFIQSCGLRKGS